MLGFFVFAAGSFGSPAAARDYYAASGQGGGEYSVFEDASTNAGTSPPGAFRVGFNGDGRERQYVGKFNFGRAVPDQVATLYLFAGSSKGNPQAGFDLDAGPHTRAGGVSVGVFLDPTIDDAKSRIDPKLSTPDGKSYTPADTEFLADKSEPLAVFTADELDAGVTLDVTEAFRAAMANHGKLRMILAPVNDDARAGDQTFVFRSSVGNGDVPTDKRLRIETTVEP